MTASDGGRNNRVPIHWVDRCKTRGVGVDPRVLWFFLRDAIRDGAGEHVRFILTTKGGKAVYEFKTEKGVFAAVVEKGTHRPITVLHERMSVRGRKPSRRRRNRKVGAREWRE